jgi:hypothetical protein
MEIVQKICQIDQGSGSPAVGTGVWSALVGSGMSRAAKHLEILAQHYRTGHQQLADELQEAAEWGKAQKF